MSRIRFFLLGCVAGAVGTAALGAGGESPGNVRVGWVTDNRYLQHLTGAGHPEKPERITAIRSALEAARLPQKLVRIPPRAASLEDLLRVHTTGHVETVRSAYAGERGALDGDTPVSAKSYETALWAAGGVLAAVDAAATGTVQRAFCAVRPPGHHASASRGMGFCLFNNVAAAARYAQQKRGLARILIVDWDAHHGNGTQAIFESDPTVFYFSVHRSPFYPGTGRADETGTGDAKGTKRNVVMAAGAGDNEYLAAFRDSFVSFADRAKPDLVFISCGFDARRDDPLGGMAVTDAAYAEMTRIVCAAADRHAKGRVVSVLEGGYNLEGIGAVAVAHVTALLGLAE